MKKLLLLAAAAASMLVAAPVFAQDSRVVIDRDEEGMVEAGFQAGFPTGLSFKYWIERRNALQAGLAWQTAAGGWVANLDYLSHSESLVREADVKVPAYIGVGGRFIQFEDPDDTAFGPRIPIGVTAILQDVPISVFAEIAPAAEFGQGEPVFTADAAVGARLVF